MLNFNDQKLNKLVTNFIHYMVDPKHNEGKQIIETDYKNFFHHIDSRDSKSNLNIVISSHLTTADQFAKAGEIIDQYHADKTPFTWCTITVDNSQTEKLFFEKCGLQHFETALGMLIDLTTFITTNRAAADEQFQEVTTQTTVHDVVKVVKSAFDLSLIDLAKYQSIWELNQDQKISYLTILTKNNIPVSTGNLYFEPELAIIDDIATHSAHQKQGYAKEMLIHLLNKAKQANYQYAGLIATPHGLPLYQKLGFESQNLYFNVYTMHYPK
ncbi:GNAT family N-acetyltransferase [Spiroplasma sp. SV19]|uniref:GNAT family N-acetyltransferase n=1 Tax=Spiroplasma sp. SV19 TaxID=2570468 RepID=UPI0024B69CED|nr:GNAT family N-acetyltransferase [Spiroplasma sp. SV19]WHQ36649.1 GNAT family N-acetyltransferase [Spiroplasma sp. SV19]